MILQNISLKTGTAFSSHIANWAQNLNVQIFEYDSKVADGVVDGLLYINENQSSDREFDEIHSMFFNKHIPTQRIDVNGTMQVAVSSFELWLKKFKCKNVLILGTDNLVNNDNLQRFLTRIEAIGGANSSAL